MTDRLMCAVAPNPDIFAVLAGPRLRFNLNQENMFATSSSVAMKTVGKAEEKKNLQVPQL